MNSRGRTSTGSNRVIYNTYYYYIKVIDDSSGEPIKSGVTIVWDPGRTGVATIQENLSSSTGVYVYSVVENNTIAPDHFECIVRAVGYQSGTCSVAQTSNATNYNPVDVRLTPAGEKYFVFYVKDTLTKTEISNAEIKIYSDSGLNTEVSADTYTLTSSGGKYFLTSQQSGQMYLKVVKNGYSTENLSIILQDSISVAEQSSVSIGLTPVSNGHYYYSVKVIDNYNNPVPGAVFELYSDLALSRPYENEFPFMKDLEARDAVFKRLRVIISTQYGISENRIKMSDDFVKDYGIESFPSDSFALAVRAAFGWKEFENINWKIIGTVEELVDYIQENCADDYTIPIPKRYISDSEGFVNSNSYENEYEALDLGVRSSVPASLYLNMISIPAGYSKEGLQVTPVYSTLSPTEQGATIILYLKEESPLGAGQYYNLMVVNRYTETPISGATIKYILNNETLSEQTTDKEGLVHFDYNTSSLYINVYKEEYQEFNNFEIKGIGDENGYIYIPLIPKNSIQVVYEDDDSPAEGMWVDIYGYDSNKKYISFIKLKTYASGYIDTLDNSFYSVGTRYATVINYDVDDISEITEFVRKGNVKIRLPYDGSDSDDDDYDFERFNDMSINNIKKVISRGNYEIKTKNKGSEKLEYIGDGFKINIIDPTTITTYDIFESSPVMMYDNQKTVVGSVDIGLKSDVNKLRLKKINRYSGYYNPIFKDILFYYNYETIKDGDRFICPYSNTSFDYEYNDNYGKFGTINNLWFHKANDNKDIDVITTLSPYYPLTGQYALDYRDYNIFSSSWDMHYYTKQVDIDHSEECQNIASMKESLCMFGSKYLNVPETIEICGFRLGNENVVWNGEWNDDWITNPEGCPGEMMYKEVNDNCVEFYFFFKKRILRYFYEKLLDEFEKYIRETFSFGKDGLEDDIEEYVTKNVLKLYRLAKVRMFVRRTKVGQHNSKIENSYTDYLEYDPDDGRFCDVSYFRKQNFDEVVNLNLVKMNRDDFDRKIVYNLKRGMKEEFGFSFILTKI